MAETPSLKSQAARPRARRPHAAKPGASKPGATKPRTRTPVARKAGGASALVRVARGASLGALAIVVAWSAGFAWFVHMASRRVDPPPEADGIVVLTGGAERVETALHLLAQGRGRKLLVSGVGGDAAFRELARRAGVDPALAARVTLGRAAADTRGNAAETASWAHDNQIGSLIVVTAGYHMPRALSELSRALPDTTLYPVPVISPVLRAEPGTASLRLLAGEYTKWLAVTTGLADLVEAEPLVERRGG